MKRLRILYRDDLVLAVDKPANTVTVPGRGDVGEPLSAQVKALIPEALIVHRLDRNTTGVVIFALTRDAHRALSTAFESRKSEKRYLALCRGDFKESVKCDLPLADARKGGMRVAGTGDKLGQPSLTEFKPLESFGKHTWLEAHPRTGRMHQIRVHLAALGYPLLVDSRYGDARPVRARELFAQAPQDEVVLARTPLHAASLRVPHPSGKGWLLVESPLPDDLSRCLDLLRAGRRAG